MCPAVGSASSRPISCACELHHGDLGPRYVMVNVPAAQIEAVENDRVVLRHTAIVGKIDRQTPILNSQINEIIVNPYWNAPESIVRKDIIPLMRKNPKYLTENNIRILGPDGNEIDPSTIDWNTEDAAKFRFRQDPGAINAMASVKINFPSPHGVYMHDTPQQSLFDKLMRFDSSGCVRVQNVRDLVTWLLRDTPGWDRQHFEQTIKSGENMPVQLADAGAGLFHLHLGLVDGRRRRAFPRRHLRPRRRRRAADQPGTVATRSTSDQKAASGRPFRFRPRRNPAMKFRSCERGGAGTTVLMARRNASPSLHHRIKD